MSHLNASHPPGAATRRPETLSGTSAQRIAAAATLLIFGLPSAMVRAQPPPAGQVSVISSRTFDPLFTISPGEPGDGFGWLLGGGDFFTRATERDLVMGAPRAVPAGDGGAPHGKVWAVDADTGELLGSMAGDALAGGPVRHLGHSIGVLGHPTRTELAWWALGAPGEPGTRDKGVVIVTVDEALMERYRLRGPRGALFGWKAFTLGSDVAGEGPGGAAVDIAGELVEQDDQRNEAPVRVRPAVQPARQGPLQRDAEPVAAGAVGTRVGPEPESLAIGPARTVIIQFAEPEIVDFLDNARHVNRSATRPMC